MLKALLESPNIQVVAIIASTRNLKIRENKLLSDLKRIKQSGVHYALYLWFVTSGYKAFQIFSKLQSIESISSAHNIPIHKTNNINTPEIADVVQGLQPEILLCAHFNQLVSPTTYSLASDIALNIHPSILPDLKGVDPGFYALQENYRQTGTTLHALAEEFDEGATIAQKVYDVCDSDTLLSLNQSLFNLGSQLLDEYLKNPKRYTQYILKSDKPSRYDSWPSKKQVNNLRKKRKLISLHDLKQLFHNV